MKPQQYKEQNQKLHKHDLSTNARIIAGVDEAGRGPLAGPVVTAAVIVKDAEFEMRIDDSKKLSAKARERAYEAIMQQCFVSFSITSHNRIDEINIYQATLESMAESVIKLNERCDLVLVDGPIQLNVPFPVRGIPQGDSKSLAIACASIVAKVTRDKLMLSYHDEFPCYGFDKHKGYGTAQHMQALKEHGPCVIHRRSFAPVVAVS